MSLISLCLPQIFHQLINLLYDARSWLVRIFKGNAKLDSRRNWSIAMDNYLFLISRFWRFSNDRAQNSSIDNIQQSRTNIMRYWGPRRLVDLVSWSRPKGIFGEKCVFWKRCFFARKFRYLPECGRLSRKFHWLHVLRDDAIFEHCQWGTILEFKFSLFWSSELRYRSFRQFFPDAVPQSTDALFGKSLLRRHSTSISCFSPWI